MPDHRYIQETPVGYASCMRGAAPIGRTGRPRGRLLSTIAAGLLLSSTLAACDLGAAEEPPSSTTPVTPTPSASDPVPGEAILIRSVDGQAVQSGTADIEVSTSSVAGGTIEPIEGPDGEPAF